MNRVSTETFDDDDLSFAHRRHWSFCSIDVVYEGDTCEVCGRTQDHLGTIGDCECNRLDTWDGEREELQPTGRRVRMKAHSVRTECTTCVVPLVVVANIFCEGVVS